MDKLTQYTLEIEVADGLPAQDYIKDDLAKVFECVLTFIDQKITEGLKLPYYLFDDTFYLTDWQNLSKSISIYICDTQEGLNLNQQARSKNYATNILSYPSDLPKALLTQMGDIFLGELVICHEVVKQQAIDQQKSFSCHLTHLIVHGILHLLGFDHELGQSEQDEMEGFEIDILQRLGVGNPYQI